MRSIADSYFDKGVESGIEKGIEQGTEKGIIEGIKKTAVNMLKQNLSFDIVKSVTGLSSNEIIRLKDKI